MSTTLHAAGVTKGFGSRDTPVLRGVDLVLEPGCLTVVRGEPGAGKSTLLHCLGGTYRLDGGRVRLRDGAEEHAVSADDARAVVWLRRHHLGLADGRLVCAPREPAVAAVARALERAGAETTVALYEARGVLDGLGLASLTDTPVGLLSRRESRALAIARSLLRSPGVLLLDEPTLGLDANGSRYVIGLVGDARDAGAAILASAREAGGVDPVADVELRLRDGRLA